MDEIIPQKYSVVENNEEHLAYEGAEFTAASNSYVMQNRAEMNNNAAAEMLPALMLTDDYAAPVHKSAVAEKALSEPSAAASDSTAGVTSGSTPDAVPGSTSDSREFREDGSVAFSTQIREDGTSQFTTYYEPTTPETADDPSAPLIGIGTPEQSLTQRPDGSSEYAHYDHSGERDYVQQTDARGNVTSFTRQADGSFRAEYAGVDGSVGSGTFDAELNPISTELRTPDGSRVQTDSRRDGSQIQTTYNVDGSQNITQRDRAGNTTNSRYIGRDGSRIDTSSTNDGELRESYAPNGERIGTMVIPPMSNYSLSPLPNGGVHITIHAADGSGALRTVSTDANGNFLSETSMYPGGQRVRERIDYDVNNGTRTVSRYNSSGEATQRRSEPYLPGRYSFSAAQ